MGEKEKWKGKNRCRRSLREKHVWVEKDKHYCQKNHNALRYPSQGRYIDTRGAIDLLTLVHQRSPISFACYPSTSPDSRPDSFNFQVQTCFFSFLCFLFAKLRICHPLMIIHQSKESNRLSPSFICCNAEDYNTVSHSTASATTRLIKLIPKRTPYNY